MHQIFIKQKKFCNKLLLAAANTSIPVCKKVTKKNEREREREKAYLDDSDRRRCIAYYYIY